MVNDPLFEQAEPGPDPVAALERDLRRHRRRFWLRLAMFPLLLVLLLTAAAPRLAGLPGPRER